LEDRHGITSALTAGQDVLPDRMATIMAILSGSERRRSLPPPLMGFAHKIAILGPFLGSFLNFCAAAVLHEIAVAGGHNLLMVQPTNPFIVIRRPA